MHCDLIIEFVTCQVQHVFIQVDGLVNQNYELIVADGTKLEDIITFSLWKKKFSFYKELINLFSIGALATILLENVSSTIFGKVKLISTLSFIIISPVSDKEAQEHLEDIHKALTLGTIFWTNLEVI
jgi:hypothetical protein